MLRSRLYAVVGAGALAAGLSLTMASPAAAGIPECQTAAHDHLGVAPADSAKACQQATGGDSEKCVAALKKASKGKYDEGAARGACIAAQY